MKYRPILFSGAMVRALLAGTKSQTRRIIKGLDKSGHTIDGNAHAEDLCCPYGKPGDRLWVRETWYCDDCRVYRGPYLKPDDLDMDTLYYRADGEASQQFEEVEPGDHFWKPSIHMPRWASRITLEITEVRVQRLNDISEEDSRAEGIDLAGINLDVAATFDRPMAYVYRRLWESINGAGSGDANPLVWAITFKRITP